jgi:hypothetical protein
MVDNGKFSESVFKVIKSFGHNVQLFDTGGASAVDPKEARRFYIKNLNTMINFEDMESPRELKVNIGKGTEVQDIRPMLDTLRTLANKNIIEYTLRTFGKSLEPKDFSYQAKAKPVKESMSRLAGSKRKSYQTLENARLIITHRKDVNEEKRGSRSRNIHSIYVECDGCGRQQFPSTNLAAARAMLQHKRHNGQMDDAIGEHIISLANEFSSLREFANWSRKNSLISEDTAEILEGVKARLKAIRETFKQLKGTKGYRAYAENFSGLKYDVDEDLVNEIRNQFTVKLFDETVAEALPHVAGIVTEISDKQRRTDVLKKLVNKVTTSTVTTDVPLDSSDPDHPDNMKFSNPTAKASIMAGYLARFVTDDEVSNLLGQLSDDIHDMDAKEQNMAAKALLYIMKSSKVREATHVPTIALDSKEVDSIEQVMESLDNVAFFLN